MSKGKRAGSAQKEKLEEVSTGPRPIGVVGTTTAGFIGAAALLVGGLVGAVLWVAKKARSSVGGGQ